MPWVGCWDRLRTLHIVHYRKVSDVRIETRAPMCDTVLEIITFYNRILTQNEKNA